MGRGNLGARLGRLGAFLLCVGVGLTLLWRWAAPGRVVEAPGEAEAGLFALGAAGLELAARPGHRAPRVLELNGTPVRLEVGARPESVEAVLDEAQEACVPIRAEDELASRAIRTEDGASGFVACLVRLTSDQAEATEIESGALIGYRYLYARPGTDDTLVVQAWTDRRPDLGALFPTEGDAPGEDAPEVPRPPKSRRIFSAREQGTPQQITVYKGREKDSGELAAWYLENLPALGWGRLVDTSNPGPRVLIVDRAGALATLVFTKDRAGNTLVTILTSL